MNKLPQLDRHSFLTWQETQIYLKSPKGSTLLDVYVNPSMDRALFSRCALSHHEFGDLPVFRDKKRYLYYFFWPQTVFLLQAVAIGTRIEASWMVFQ